MTCKLGNFGWNENDHVACIGLVVENTSDAFRDVCRGAGVDGCPDEI